MIDLISPYILQGDTFGQWHAFLAALRVASHETASDENGITIRGLVEFEGQWSVDPRTMSLSYVNTENHPENDASRRDPWLDIRDTHLDFSMVIPRVPSQKVVTAVTAIGTGNTFDPSRAVINAFDNDPTNADPSDYPTTGFTLDLLLTGVVLRPPFLRGAKRENDGRLVPDLQNDKVRLTLPRIKFRVQQGPLNNDPITATLLSLGASGMDDPGDIAVAELIKMEPPYAFIGPSNVVGFGFRSAVLDLSTASTPPDVLSQFGFDESWTGLYLPEVRLFIAPHGARDFAVEGGAENLLIGIGSSSGITGDFNLQVINQGAGPLKLSARFYDADGRGYGIVRTSDTTADVQLPARAGMVVDVDGGRPPVIVNISINGTAQPVARTATIDLSSSQQATIVINASEAGGSPRTAAFTITARRRPAPVLVPGTTSTGPIPDAVIVSQTAVQGSATVTQPQIQILTNTPTGVIVGLSNYSGSGTPAWTVNGAPAGSGATATVEITPGGPDVTVAATLPGSSGVTDFTAYYRFDKPPYLENGRVLTDDEIRAFALQSENTHTTEAADQGTTASWIGGSAVRSALLPVLQSLPDKALPDSNQINIRGYASYEGPPPPNVDISKRDYNTALAARRAKGLRAIMEDLIADPANNLAPKRITLSDAPEMSNWENQGYPAVETRRIWWKAVATSAAVNTPGTTVTATLHRNAPTSVSTPPRIEDPPPPPNQEPPSPPSWFQQMGAKVRIVRNQFVACEVFAKIHVQTAAQERLNSSVPPGNPSTLPSGTPLGANPADGLIDFRLVVQIDDATDTVSVIGYYGADPADIDGLFLWGTPSGQAVAQPKPPFGLNFLGTSITFMPLLSAAVGAVENQGALAEIAMGAGMFAIPAAIAGLSEVGGSPIKIYCERVIWYGGEVQFRVRPSGPEAVILFDLESALSMDISLGGKTLLAIERDSPLTVRYKAVGIRIGDDPNGRFHFRPVFDASKGYTIDVGKPGSIKVASPLDSILKILGARIAKNNPMIFEVDLGFAVDLGVVSIDRARVRVKFNEPPASLSPSVELTAFGAGIDIPGALRGRGYMELNENEIKGQIDLTIVPVQVRIAAGVGVANIVKDGRKAVGVIVTLEVEFPVAIPLGTSGLGIYGFLGLFAMHYTRKEPPAGDMAPALAWLKNVAGGNPANIAAWTPEIDHWAFGVGAIVGTMGSSVMFNMKGVVLLELPGPRLLLMMKAKLLAVMPKLKDTAEGTFLAVIDLDMGRGTLTIGISVDFAIKPLLQITIPVEAFFNFNNRKDWHLYLGKYTNQIHASILEVFEGSGYLMLSGKGFSSGEISSNLPTPVNGFAISTGLHVSYVWGNKSSGLYAEVAAGFDAVVGFDPFRLTGTMYVRGTLRLFIVSIGAYANLTVDVGEKPDGSKVAMVSGQICGKVEFLFFSVEGCVDFTLGGTTPPALEPPALFQSLKLISRSPALATGTGVDKPIDAGVAEGTLSEVQPAPPPPPPPPAPIGQPGPDVPMKDRRAPIDAIPVCLFAMPPVAGGAQYFFRGAAADPSPGPGTPGAPPDGWIQRGNDWFQYTLKKVELIGELLDGSTPVVWWPQKSGDEPKQAQLALLSLIPDPTPKAIERSTFLEETITETWGTVCQPAAPPTSVFYTFLKEPVGPSLYGWILDGEAWPDPPTTIRSVPSDTSLKVTERWRTGVQSIDSLTGIIPAVIEGAQVVCPPNSGKTVPRSRLAVGTRLGVPATLTVNPVIAAKGVRRPDVIAAEGLSIADLAKRISTGMEVSRSMLTNSMATSAVAVPAQDAKCSSRLLAAPIFDSRDVRPFGDRSRIEALKEARARRGFKPGPYDDAIVFHTGAVESATFYLLVQRALLAEKLMVVAATDKDDNVLLEQVLDTTMMVPPGTFPPRWTDSTGPWYDDAFHVVQQASRLGESGYVGVIVTVKGNKKADRIQIGLKSQNAQWHRSHAIRPFYAAGAEVLTSAEFFRSDYDTTEQKKKQGVLEAALSESSSGQALLKPNTAYAVRATYDVSRGKKSGGTVTPELTKTDQHETFWFYTDNEAPRRLDPWMMCSTPEDGEHHYFALLPIHIVFNTPDVARIYDAYGKQLQVRLRAASFHKPPSTPAVPHPLPISGDFLKPVKASVLSPWEAVIEDQLTSSCVPTSGKRIRHTMVTAPIPLDPFTDYKLDIEMQDKGAAPDSPGTVIWRITFSTGRFTTVEQFAKSFSLNRILNRFSTPGKLQEIGTKPWAANPQGHQLDQAMTESGLEPMGVPEAPRIVIFWQQDSPSPQPAAVLIDSSEPMWRSRKIPIESTDPNPPNAARYEMTPTEWLRLEQEPGGDPIVDKIVRAPGGQRALITLKPSSRGKTLRLCLRQIAQKQEYLDGPSATDRTFTIVNSQLAAAPWEEQD